MRHNLEPFHLSGDLTPPLPIAPAERPHLASRPLGEYASLKHLEGEILDYVTQLQRQALRTEAAARMTAQIVSARHALQSAKGIKDVRHNLAAYADDEPDRARMVRDLGETLLGWYRQLSDLWRIEEPNVRFETLAGLKAKNRARYVAGSRAVQQRLAERQVSPLEVSTELNINREIYASTKALLEAVAWQLLDAQAAARRDALCAPAARGPPAIAFVFRDEPSGDGVATLQSAEHRPQRAARVRVRVRIQRPHDEHGLEALEANGDGPETLFAGGGRSGLTASMRSTRDPDPALSRLVVRRELEDQRSTRPVGSRGVFPPPFP
jgi:hypothetical protein